MSLASSRRTYDTDSIVLRRIFAYDISNNSPFSTGFVLTSLTKGVASFISPNLALSTIGVPNLPAQLSTLEGELVSTAGAFYPSLPSSPNIFLPSTVTGLGTAGYISTSALQSTIAGLGTYGYLSSSVFGDILYSSIEGLGTYGYLSTLSFYSTMNNAFPSTVKGLGSSQYVSTSQLTSTVQGLGNIFISSTSFFSTFNTALPSTVAGLGTAKYISSTQLISTVEGLGSSRYVSSTQLISTVEGLGSAQYISSSQLLSSIQGVSYTNIRSTYTNSLAGNWNTYGFLYSNIAAFSTVKTFQFDLGAGVREKMAVSTTNLDIEFKANLQFGYYDSRSIQYDFSTCLVKGVSLNTSTIIAQENISYYILNASLVNLPFFFTEKYRFVLNDLSTISTLKSDTSYSTLSLFHRIGVSSPTTNQLFVYPAIPTSITVVVDNSTRTAP